METIEENLYINNCPIGAYNRIDGPKDTWYLLDNCYLSQMDGKDVYATHAVREGDAIMDIRAPLYRVAMPIINPEAATPFEQVGGHSAKVLFSQVRGTVRVDTEQIEDLMYLELNLRDALQAPAEVLSARRTTPRSDSYHLMGKDKDGGFVTWTSFNSLFPGQVVPQGTHYQTANEAMVAHICHLGEDLVSNPVKLQKCGTDMALAGFRSNKHIGEVKDVMDFIMREMKKDGQKAGFYAQRVHEFTEALFIQNQITLNPAQQKVVDQMSDVIYNQEVNKPENQQLCKKMVQTISKVVDQTADRQGAR